MFFVKQSFTNQSWRGLYPFGHAYPFGHTGGIVKFVRKYFVFVNLFVKQSFTIHYPEGVRTFRLVLLVPDGAPSGPPPTPLTTWQGPDPLIRKKPFDY